MEVIELNYDSKGPRVRECRRLLEAGKGKEVDSPLSFQKKCSPADALIINF